jgi:dCMP deaminase
MNVARAVALRAPCSRARVGAVVVDATNRIIATGYNGPPAGLVRPWWYECDGSEAQGGFCVRGKHGPQGDPTSYADCPSLHAEENALSFCDRREREHGTIYVTSPTCNSCAKLVANSGLGRIVLLDDSDREYRVAGEWYEFLEDCGVDVEIIKDA